MPARRAMSSVLVRRRPVRANCSSAASRMSTFDATPLPSACTDATTRVSLSQMSHAPQPARSDQDRTPAPVGGPTLTIEELLSEPGLMLGSGSAVMYQLALWEVGKGVAEHSDTLQRPLDRLRTTLSYVYVMGLGTDEEKAAIARMVNRAHRPVKGEGYTAYDPELQLWVAAT